MGTNNTHSKGNDEDITHEDFNQFDSALKGDHVPRNSSGAPTASAGSLGTQDTPWRDLHVSGSIYQNGTELSGGHSSSSTTAALRNGVVSGKAPANRPGVCGWMVQAGSNGVQLLADAANPLVVKLDGVSYSLTSNLSGGTLPSSVSLSRTLQSYTTPSGGYNADEYYEYSQRTRPKYMLATGGIFRYGTSSTDEVPAANGDIFIAKHGSGASTGYVVCQRHTISGTPCLAKLAVRQALNTSTTGYSHPYQDLPSNGGITIIRTGYVFADPTTNTWSISISARIVGVVDVLLPGTTGYATGDMIYRELDGRWYRFSGSAWQKTANVYLGLVAVDGTAAVGVMGVRGEAAMTQMLTRRNNILGDSVFRVGTEENGTIYFSGVNDLEVKTLAGLQAQELEKEESDPVIVLDEDGTLANSTLFCCYLDCDSGTYFYEDVAPMMLYYGSKLIHAHPYRHAVFFGSFATDGSGNVITRVSITGSQEHEGALTESNDDSWWINPLLYLRIEFYSSTDATYGASYPRARFPDIELRQGTGTSSQTFNGENLYINSAGAGTGLDANANQFYYTTIQPHVIDGYRWEIYDSNISASARPIASAWSAQEMLDQLL